MTKIYILCLLKLGFIHSTACPHLPLKQACAQGRCLVLLPASAAILLVLMQASLA